MRRTSVEIAAQLVSVTANLTFGQSAFLSDNKMIIIWMTAILCSASYLAKVVNFETDVYVWSSKSEITPHDRFALHRKISGMAVAMSRPATDLKVRNNDMGRECSAGFGRVGN